MREIKFRAWDTVLSKFFDGDILNDYNLGDFLNDDRYIVTQYTGLKDVNGVEIFEGDILGFCDFDSLRTGGNTSDKMHTAVVKFSEGSWVVEDGGYCDYLYQVIANDSELEIIGNAYENKELLEVAE